jgi:hypothetical protein
MTELEQQQQYAQEYAKAFKIAEGKKNTNLFYRNARFENGEVVSAEVVDANGNVVDTFEAPKPEPEQPQTLQTGKTQPQPEVKQSQPQTPVTQTQPQTPVVTQAQPEVGQPEAKKAK